MLDIYKVWNDWGVRAMEVPTSPDGRVCDIWTESDTGDPANTNVNDNPSLGEELAAGETLIKFDAQPHLINPSDPGAIETMCAVLDGDPALPIHACGFVDTAFMRLTPIDVAQAPDTTDRNGGGHAFWFSAYRTNPITGEREFRLENSWGDWCDHGAGWVSEAFVRACWVLVVIDPVLAAKEAA
jgi:hypothetical protein